eukprot:scaffold62571_cov57-Phaeocystis_antarctica.AAC.2
MDNRKNMYNMSAKTKSRFTETPLATMLTACHLRSPATYALTQLLRRWSRRSLGPRRWFRKSVGPRRCIQWSVGPRRWLVDLAASLLPGGAAIGEALASAMEDEHLDFADRGHGRLARLVGQQAVLLEHGLVQAGPVV